jgi:hypothetical protein
MTNESFFKAGKMPRNQFQINLTITAVQTDHWINYLGPEVYCWWLKFHSWIDNKSKYDYKNHIPYTLESVMSEKYLNVSQTTFYRKIKKLWECGLIEIYEFEPSERKAQKPKNIFVYSYPFNNAELQYKPLEKLRDWKTEYESESKIAGIKGALIKKSKEKEREKSHPPKSGRVENPVDNSPISVDNPVDNSPVDNVDNLKIDPPKSERVDPPKSERVTLPDLGANQLLNNLFTKTNNLNQSLNNSLSQTKIDLIQEQLKIFDFKEGERERIIELIIIRGLFSITKQDIAKQAQFMATRPNIRDRSLYFVNGLKINEGRTYPTKATTNQDQEAVTTPLPLYNWLEN